MYTEIYVNVNLVSNLPKDILEILQVMCESCSPSTNRNEEHYKKILGNLPGKWLYLFRDGSYYTPSTSCAILSFDPISTRWSLLGKGDIKNYEREIETFFAFLMPYIDAPEGCFIGYQRYEEDLLPTLYVKK